MKDYLVLTSQKNDTLECIREAGLNPLSFEWGEAKTNYPLEDYTVSILRHLGSDFYFKFDRALEGHYMPRFFPGQDRSFEVSESKKKWNDVLDDLAGRLSCLKREFAPDLWGQLKDFAPDETFIGTAEISNAPFSDSEAENVIKSLDKLQAQIEENFKLQGDQLAFVSRQIEYLKDAAKRQGRKDWVHTSIGVIVTIATFLALSPEKAKLLWDLIRSCFAPILPLPAP
jgi:hypothetical protein